ncbi:hypothetical protein [Vibrio owensii]|uniref:hypothetical protein n=1 Tax=Vibrio owensii TaxID=696485 RepID=UPI0018F1CE00|nr:hypothetical protein [Vibrio owensii]
MKKLIALVAIAVTTTGCTTSNVQSYAESFQLGDRTAISVVSPSYELASEVDEVFTKSVDATSFTKFQHVKGSDATVAKAFNGDYDHVVLIAVRPVASSGTDCHTSGFANHNGNVDHNGNVSGNSFGSSSTSCSNWTSWDDATVVAQIWDVASGEEVYTAKATMSIGSDDLSRTVQMFGSGTLSDTVAKGVLEDLVKKGIIHLEDK